MKRHVMPGLHVKRWPQGSDSQDEMTHQVVQLQLLQKPGHVVLHLHKGSTIQEYSAGLPRLQLLINAPRKSFWSSNFFAKLNAASHTPRPSISLLPSTIEERLE